MAEEKDSDRPEHGAVGWKERVEQCETEKWERRKLMADALIRFVEKVADTDHQATDGELHALPGVADVCRRLL